MPWWRFRYFWIPLYAIISIYFLYTYKAKGIILLLLVAGTVGIADLVSSKTIKPLVNRDRPCQNKEIKEEIRLLVHCSTGKSFTSSHATNHFALALVLIFILKGRFKWVWLAGIGWAASICWGQVYVGVHFPLDVLCGAISGSIIGFIMGTLSLKYIKRYIESSV